MYKVAILKFLILWFYKVSEEIVISQSDTQ